VDGSPIKEPDGEGPNGESYAFVQDGDNYWAVTSDYVSVANANTPASFLGNHGAMDVRNTGRGAAMWHCRGSNHNFDDAYFVSLDTDGGAAVVGFANTTAEVLTGCSFMRAHIESDGGDTDAATGLDFGFEFRSATAGRDVQIDQFSFSDHAAHSQIAVFRAGTNVASVKFLTGCSVDISLGRDVGQVVFDDPALFSYYGEIFCDKDGTAPFFNISALADVGGHVHCRLGTASTVRHPTGTYMLTDEAGRLEMVNGLTVSGDALFSMDPSTGVMGMAPVNNGTGAVLARWRYSALNSRWELSSNGSAIDYLFSDAVFRAISDATVDLGSATARFDTGYFNALRANAYRDANGVKLFGLQGAAVANSTGTAVDNQRAINDLLARARTQGWIAT
jgi:hypothetical protein